MSADLVGEANTIVARVAVNEPLLQLKAVSRTFVGDGGATEALADVDLVIRAGEFLCVTGPSGSGKTTLLNIIGCLDRPSSGEYRFAGTQVGDLDDNGFADLRRGAFGFVFQSYNLLGNLSALRNVVLATAYADSGEVRPGQKKAKNLLQSFGVGDRLDHLPGELSGGEQQRVAIARALVNGAGIILADEPIGALDADQGTEILDLLEELVTLGHTVIIVSHDDRVAARAHRCVELLDGRVVADSGASSSTHVPLEPTAASGGSSWLSTAREGIIAVRNERLSAMLTICSIALGIWASVTLLAMTEGVRRDALAAVERMGANRLTIGGDETVGDVTRSLPKTLADAEAIEHQVPNVQSVQPSIMRQLPVRAGGTHLPRVLVRASGAPEPRTFVQNLSWPMQQGTYLTGRDHDGAALVAVIGPVVRDRLFAATVNPVGEHIVIKGMSFLVKGVLTRQPRFVGEGEIFATDPEEAVRGLALVFGTTEANVLIPLKTGVNVLFGTDKLTRLDVLVDDVSRIDETAAAIRDLMYRRHGRSGYTVRNEAETWTLHKRLNGMYAAILATIAAVALLAGGLGIVSVALAAVSRRRHEIGIRMAIGARRRDILAQFLVEATSLTVIGGVCGLLLALVGTPLLAALIATPMSFAPWFVPVALACAVATGLACGVIPARRAARLDPVAILNSG